MDTRTPPEIDSLARRIEPILSAYPEIAAAYVFGSVARGDATAASDLDLGLVLGTAVKRTALHRLLGDLAAQLEVLTAPRLIDVVVLDDQGPVFCHEVLLDGHLIYEADRERRIDFESDTIILAIDFRPTLDLATRGYVGGFRSWLRSYRDRPRRATPA